MQPTPTSASTRTPTLANLAAQRLSFKEKCVLSSLIALSAIAAIGHFAFPLTPANVQALMLALGLHAHGAGQSFADSRAMLALPNAADVLSNLPFLAFGVWGLMRLRGHELARENTHPQRSAMRVFFAGLVCTAVGSMWFHLAPSNATLLWDRAGMGLAFAGVLSVAVGQRVSVRMGAVTLYAALIGAAAALCVWVLTEDVLAWSVVQFGGMLLILMCAVFKPAQSTRISGCTPVNLMVLIGFYALAKAFESLDWAVFQATGQLVSGHSLKHLAASFAALPVLASLQGERA